MKNPQSKLDTVMEQLQLLASRSDEQQIKPVLFNEWADMWLNIYQGNCLQYYIYRDLSRSNPPLSRAVLWKLLAARSHPYAGAGVFYDYGRNLFIGKS